MLHLKHLAVGISLALAATALPFFMPAYASNQPKISIPAKQDPQGFCDLYWGEPLTEVQNEYKLTFLKYEHGRALYVMVYPNPHGNLGFNGPTELMLNFRANKLLAIAAVSAYKPEHFINLYTKMFGQGDVFKILTMWRGPQTGIAVQAVKDPNDPNKTIVWFIEKNESIKLASNPA